MYVSHGLFFLLGNSKKSRKMNRKNQMLSKNDEEKAEVQQYEVYEISSGDEDYTAGMKSKKLCCYVEPVFTFDN